MSTSERRFFRLLKFYTCFYQELCITKILVLTHFSTVNALEPRSVISQHPRTFGEMTFLHVSTKSRSSHNIVTKCVKQIQSKITKLSSCGVEVELRFFSLVSHERQIFELHPYSYEFIISDTQRVKSLWYSCFAQPYSGAKKKAMVLQNLPLIKI